jgi:protein involved in polysaccharide export with SLBB domain/uncharacterized protein involved in exopolysaccharide biosynthesis/Mrp family chromosome partitioning ATPase
MDSKRPGSESLRTQDLPFGNSRGSRGKAEWPCDPWRLVDALVLRRRWLLISGALAFSVCLVWGYLATGYTATVKIIRNHPPAFTSAGLESDAFKSQAPTLPTLVHVLRSPDLQQRVAAKSNPPIHVRGIGARLEVVPLPNTELAQVTLHGISARATVNLINLYAAEAIGVMQELQAKEIEELNQSLKESLSATDEDLERHHLELAEFQKKEGLFDFDKETSARVQERAELELKAENLRIELDTLDLQMASLLAEIRKQSPALIAAKEALDQARITYTEAHPKVIQLRAAVASIENELAVKGDQIGPEAAARGGSVGNSLYSQLVSLRTQKIALDNQLKGINVVRTRLQTELNGLPEKQWKFAKIKAQLELLKKRREYLADRQQEAQLRLDNATGYFRILQQARLEDLSWRQPLKGGLLWGFGAALFGVLASGLVIVGMELADRRIRSRADLKRVTRLPVLATLGNLDEMSVEDREQWAFKTLASLKGKLNSTNREALVCGFTSSSHGEGRSTWVKLLAGAAEKQGYRVLTIAAGCGAPHTVAHGLPAAPEPSKDPQVPAAPFEIARAISAPSLKPVLRLPADWVWNLQQREQWQEALRQWKSMDQLVVLVELPPASEAEAVLLAENMPQLIWLCGKDSADARETRAQLETLRHSRSNLVGGVFNRATRPAWRPHLDGSLAGVLLLLTLLLTGVQGQDGLSNNPKGEAPLPMLAEASPAPKVGLPPQETPEVVTNAVAPGFAPMPNRLASWQTRLTLGPGDVLDISLYDKPETLRAGLFIGPDGRLNYLQARDVEASGLTVDELRDKLEKILATYYLGPRVVIQPRAFNSKKYFVLGNVAQKGVFPLDRPITIVEAVARARGFETTGQTRNSLITADLSRSFLIRKNPDGTFQQVAVDLEGLFFRGDFNQNLVLAPEDYLYFPPLDLQEVYVLGEVRTPGVVAFAPEMSALGAIVSKGGFTEKAYRSKILVVRGSLSHPQCFVVNASDILAARSGDFPLKARDIVYVNRKPWSKVQELLEAAAQQYAYSMVYGWTTLNVGPFTKSPFVPSIK